MTLSTTSPMRTSLMFDCHAFYLSSFFRLPSHDTRAGSHGAGMASLINEDVNFVSNSDSLRNHLRLCVYTYKVLPQNGSLATQQPAWQHSEVLIVLGLIIVIIMIFSLFMYK